MMMNKIIIVCLKLSNGGSERVLSILANSFAERGYDVDFVILYDYEPDYRLSERVNIIELKWKNSCNLVECFYRWRQLRNTIIQRDAVIISFLFRAVFWVAVSTAFLDTKRIYSERNDPRKDPNKWYKRALRNVCFNGADKLVFQTEEQMRLFPEKLREKGVVIENPVIGSMPICNPERCEKIVISVCRYEKQKNIKLSIDAFEEFHKFHNDFRFHIYGRGTLENELKLYIDSKNLNDCITLEGFHQDVFEKMSQAMIFLSSSDYEGISNSILEALAIGLPVICTDCPVGGNRVLIDNGVNGYLVSKGDLSAMVHCLTILAEDNELRKRMSFNARFVRTKYSISNIADKWDDLVKKM